MKWLQISLAVCSWSLVKPQTLDQIFFADNRPQIQNNLNVNPNDNRNRLPTDSYLQAIQSNNNVAQYPLQPVNNPNVNRNPQANFAGLQPPGNGQIEYYTKYNDDVGNRQNLNDQTSRATNLLNGVNNGSRAITHFGLSMMQNIGEGNGNVVISPYSVATVLALIQQGALGDTQRQISTALHMQPDISTEVFRRINGDIQKRSSRNVLRVASNVYVADAFNLNPAFKRVAKQDFGSEATLIKFTRPEEAARQINSWVAEKTNNKIRELLQPGNVGENTQLVLVNAVYFKGIWQTRFKTESTHPRPFRLADGSTKMVPFMRIRQIFKTGVDHQNSARVVILPFEDEQYSLVVVLPTELSSLTSLLLTLSPDQLADYQNFTPKEVDLEIPKFTVKADTDLNPVLRKMGVTNMFGPKSELTGLGTYQTYSPQVTAAVHSAMFSIDEDGGSAAASTAFAAVALSYDDQTIVFKANRPFLAVLWDNHAALPLFMARIEDPIL